MDWNDLRYFLAVARGGSTLAAGRELRVSQTTVARRVAALEQALGFPLFERRQAGYALTPAGEALLARAEEVEASATGFADAAAAHSRDVSGTVCITSEEIYMTQGAQAIVTDRNWADAYFLKGFALIDADRANEAIGWFDKALALSPKNAHMKRWPESSKSVWPVTVRAPIR